MTSTYMITPYTQYNESKQMTDWAECINKYIQDFLTTFFSEFKRQLNLRDGSTDNSYSFFYLANYYGITRIPNPSTSRALAKNLFDEAVKFDEDGTYYDDTVSDAETISMYMNPRLFTSIARFNLNYKYRVFNVPAIGDLLRDIYKAFTYKELDLNTIKFIPEEDMLTIEMPNEEVWNQVKLVSKYSPELLGLPFGGYLNFTITGDAG